MRITISDDDANTIIQAIKNNCDNLSELDLLCLHELASKIEAEQEKTVSVNKQLAMSKATSQRVTTAKRKIFDAMRLMKMEDRKISVNSVSIYAKVSYNTANKYRKEIDEFVASYR
jgi:hypothetical protein